MKNRAFLFLFVLTTAFSALHATNGDSLRHALPIPSPMSGQKIQLQNKELETYLHIGFRLGTDFVISNRQLSNFDKLENVFSGTFGFFARGGYQHVFGELGLQYMFFKGHYEAYTLDSVFMGRETVESRYLQIPLRVIGYFPVGQRKIVALMPHIGIMYQPLIHVTNNDIKYSKHNLMQHQFLYQAGFGCRIKFFTVEVAWKRAIRPFFQDRTSVKQSYINLMVGFQF